MLKTSTFIYVSNSRKNYYNSQVFGFYRKVLKNVFYLFLLFYRYEKYQSSKRFNNLWRIIMMNLFKVFGNLSIVFFTLLKLAKLSKKISRLS